MTQVSREIIEDILNNEINTYNRNQKRTLIIKQMDELIIKHTKLQDPENIDVLKMFIHLTQEVKDYNTNNLKISLEDYTKL